MSVPKKRRSRSKVRRSAAPNNKITTKTLVKRKDSAELTLPHVASATTGTYKGRQVIDVEKRTKRAERKRKRGA